MPANTLYTEKLQRSDRQTANQASSFKCLDLEPDTEKVLIVSEDKVL